MSSTIPPLVCNTPPPIDFDHDDDDACSEGIDSTFSPSEDDVSLPATPKHSKTNKKHMKHVCDRELSSSVADDEANDTIASQHGTVPAESNADDAFKIESAAESIADHETITNEIDNASSRHAESIELECAMDAERCEAENETQISSNSIQVVIESPPPDPDYDRNESPPSLELASGKYSDNECDINEVNEEFDDFQRNSNELSVDTNSLPSLNFDSIRNSPDFKSDEIDDKKSEPDEEKITTASDEIIDDEALPKLDATPEPEYSTNPIEIADENVLVVDDNFAFDADFSQFATFDSEIQTRPSVESNEPYVESKAIDGDFEDDFGDFEEAPTMPAHTPLAEISKSSSLDLKSISERFKSILDTAFPVSSDEDDEDTSSAPSNNEISTNKIENFINGTTTHLKNFENAKAQQHQWANSTGKNVLIKALGIDARNIMYGDNWKSPLPRFAANLGYNAMEPLKPVAVDSSSASNSSNNNNITQFKSKETLSGSSIEATIKTDRSPDVPAAQFDWNSAGLVNPLDASQAHTLLLDLEQLVVMENLDKIKLDCSSSSSSSTCNSTKLRSLLGTVKSSAASIIDSTLPKMQKTGQNLDGFINHTTASFGRSTSNAFNGLLFNHAKSTHNHNVLLVAENGYQMDQPFDPYFVISPQEVVHKADTAENQLSRLDTDQKESIESDSPSGECIPSEVVLSAATPLPKPTTIPTTISKGSAAQQFEMSPADLVASLNDFEPTPQSASYSVPGSSGTLKETHIFTPIKMNITSSHVPALSNSSNASEVTVAPTPNVYPEFDFEKASAGVVINENVVKKEYRDVEYDPDKLKANTNIESDDFSEFQSVEAPAPSISMILQPTKTSTNISINWPDPGTVTNANAIDEFKNYVPNTKLEPTTEARVKHSKTNGYGFNKPTIGTSPSEDMFSGSNSGADDEFSDFQSTKAAGISYISHVSAIPDIIPTGQTFVYAKTDITPKSTAPEILQRVSLASSMGIDKYSDSRKHSNEVRTVDSPTPLASTNTAPPFASSSILVPQVASQPKAAPTAKAVSSIAWPDPGISADELARLETIFPQANKTTTASPINSSSKPTKGASSKAEDDEWSDFVSVTQPQTPITNILNQNLQKHQNNDEDDWSDFVSSAVPPPSLPPIQTQLTNTGPNFTSWNAPSPYSSWQHTAPSPMTFSQPDNFSRSPIHSMGNGMNHIITNGHAQQQSPSIISLPNLGFAAPKSLVNMPKPNLAKK